MDAAAAGVRVCALGSGPALSVHTHVVSRVLHANAASRQMARCKKADRQLQVHDLDPLGGGLSRQALLHLQAVLRLLALLLLQLVVPAVRQLRLKSLRVAPEVVADGVPHQVLEPALESLPVVPVVQAVLLQVLVVQLRLELVPRRCSSARAIALPRRRQPRS